MELSFPQGSKTDVSVIVPVYGCRDCLESLLERVCAVLRSSGRTFEILLVDDFSTDGGWNLIEEISRSTTEVRGIRLSRNFGQHIAIMAGLRESRGESMVVMDCDLQDPPELIPDLLRGLMSHQVAIAVKIGKHQSYVRRLQARVYGKVLNVVTGLQTTNGLSGFVALRRAVVDQYVKFSEPDQHLLHILQWLGFDAMHIAYERPAREVGNLAMVSGLALDTRYAVYCLKPHVFFIYLHRYASQLRFQDWREWYLSLPGRLEETQFQVGQVRFLPSFF